MSDAPYYIQITDDGIFTILKYNQIKSDFHNTIVKECRGLIIDNRNNKPVCVPFFKFGNYGESYVENIDWSTARVQEKVDGSLIKVWNYEGIWHISTNGTIDATNASLQSDAGGFKNFKELFNVAWSYYHQDFSILNPDNTYMFELVSPYNRVVVPYSEIDIRHIGTRNNTTLQELEIDIDVPHPKIHSLHTFKDCINSANALPFSEEGYVVVDANWHRIKVKSPAYVAVHHLATNGAMTKSRIVELIKTNESEEFLTYYPEYKTAFKDIKDGIFCFCEDVSNEYKNMRCYDFPTRKDLAEFINDKLSFCPAVFFALYDKKVGNVKEWLYNQSTDKVLKWIGVY